MSFVSLIDVIPSAPPEDSNQNNNESIRRYFERLTLLETIYEKLNIESNKTPVQSIQQQKLTTQSVEIKEQNINHLHTSSSNKTGNYFQRIKHKKYFLRSLCL